MFWPFKRSLRQDAHTFLRKHPGRVITRYDICGLVCKAYPKGLSSANLASGFRKSGIVPLNANVVDANAFLPHTAVTQPGPEAMKVGNGMCPHAVEFLNDRLPQPTPPTKKRKQREPGIFGAITEKDLDVSQESQSLHAVSIPSSPVAGPSHVIPISDPPNDDTNNNFSPIAGPSSPTPSEASTIYEDDERCCVCRRINPPTDNNIFVFSRVKWAKCELCPHWTHLTCSPLKVIRRNTVFICQHCVEEE